MRGAQPLTSPDVLWKIVLGTGYRATWAAMDSDDRRNLEQRVRSGVAERLISEVQTNVVYSVATKAVGPMK